jgi:uncharacterized protein (DUF1697 family)
MIRWAAFLRAVNVGGAGVLPMAELRDLVAGLGYGSPKTLLASGNLVFDAAGPESEVKAALEAALVPRLGQGARVMIRTGAEVRLLIDRNPFKETDPAKTHVLLLDKAPPSDIFAGASGRRDEEAAPGDREIYLHYPMGQGASQLRLPAAALGTARNLNTLAKVAALAAAPP